MVSLHLEIMDRRRLIQTMAYGKIVDIGCFDGHFFGDKAINVDWKKYLDDIPNFILADANNLPFKDDSFDCAVLSELLEHLEKPRNVLEEASRIANVVIIGVPNEYEWDSVLNPFSGGSSHKRFFNQETLIKLVHACGLIVIECVKVNFAGWIHYIIMAVSSKFDNNYS